MHHLVGNRFDRMNGRRIGSADRKIVQRRIAGDVRVLLQRDDMRARRDGALAFVRLDLPADQLEQGRLARAIAPDERKPVALANGEIETPEQPAAALNQTEIFI